MVLAVIDVAPYPSLTPQESVRFTNDCGVLRPDLACEINPVSNRRYTMQDINAIATRVENLEYYTALSLLEQDTKNFLVPDDMGNDRFKNGFFVDNFTGHNKNDVMNSAISVDVNKQEARPLYEIYQPDIEYIANESSANISRWNRSARVEIENNTSFRIGEQINIGSVTGKLFAQHAQNLYIDELTGKVPSGASTIEGAESGNRESVRFVQNSPDGETATLTYESLRIVEQPLASTTRNVTGLFYNFIGQMELTPSVDVKIDTTEKPDVVVNIDNNADNWKMLADAWKTEWGSWETRWHGSTTTTQTFDNRETETVETTRITTTRGTALRSGRAASFQEADKTNQRIGSKVVSIGIIPYMRRKRIRFVASGLKPGARVFPFFDGKDVSEYCTSPTNFIVGNEGNEKGIVAGHFNLPAGRFKIGTKLFRLTDNPTDAQSSGSFTTSAEAEYTSQGLTQTIQDTIISTRKPQFSFETISEKRAVRNNVERTSFDFYGVPLNASRAQIEQEITNTNNRLASLDDDPSNNLLRTRLTDRIASLTARRNELLLAEQQAAAGDDPIAQTFRLNTNNSLNGVDNSKGAFLTKVDLFFATKPKNDVPVFIEIREVDPNGYQLTNKVVPFSRVQLNTGEQNNEVNVSDDASQATPIIFPTPVFLLHNVDYALVVKEVSGFTSLWVARLGETDTLSQTKITKQPYFGVMFASSNNQSWTQIHEEDLKMNLYIAQFDTNSVGTLTFKNRKTDLLEIELDDDSAILDRPDEIVWGETELTMANATNTISAGNFIVADTSPITIGEVTRLEATNKVFVKNVLPINAANFASGASVKVVSTKPSNDASYSSVSSTILNTISNVEDPPAGMIESYDATSDNIILQLVDTNTNNNTRFVANTSIQGRETGYTAKISNLLNIKCHAIYPNIEVLNYGQTNIQTSMKISTSNTTTNLSNIERIENKETYILPNERYILSASNENNNRSFEMLVKMTSSSKNLSPVVDLQKTDIKIIENIVNNDITDETNAQNGNALARYITKTIELSEDQEAEDIRVILNGYRPPSSNIHVYYKILNANDDNTLDNVEWVQMEQNFNTNTYSSEQDETNFIELEYSVSSDNLTTAGITYTSNGTTFTGYNKIKLKVVLVSSNPSNPPKIKDFRAICLQL